MERMMTREDRRDRGDSGYSNYSGYSDFSGDSVKERNYYKMTINHYKDFLLIRKRDFYR